MADQQALVLRLRAAGCVFAEDEARLLVDAAATDRELTGLADRRVAGEPLETIVGWAEFDGARILVGPGVFVPRRRTVVLVREAAARIHTDGVVLDLCCGSGAAGVAIARRRMGIELHCADVDPVQVACARRNGEPLGAHVHQGDLFTALPAGLRARVDVLVANAPYVPTHAIALMPREAREHEPMTALDGGADGLDVHRRIAAEAPDWLRPGGWLIIESSLEQAGLTADVCMDAGLASEVVRHEDVDGTAVIARLDATPCRRRRPDLG